MDKLNEQETLTELEKFKLDNRETRNTRIMELTEGDIIVDGEELRHVASGEIYIYADGSIDDDNGELVEIEREEVAYAIASGKTIFNMEACNG